jgi:DNA-binding MarR family transcriptional regulator
MADITGVLAEEARIDVDAEGRPDSDEPLWDVIELLFFAYRDFIGDADEVLVQFGFGRAHHRVLHFIKRHPGMKVADLLDLLKITKQSLGRVLRELVDKGYVVQRAGESDRRQRLLYATPKGEALALRLAGLQTLRIKAALDEAGSGAYDIVRAFLAAMLDPRQRDSALELIARAGGTRSKR